MSMNVNGNESTLGKKYKEINGNESTLGKKYEEITGRKLPDILCPKRDKNEQIISLPKPTKEQTAEFNNAVKSTKLGSKAVTEQSLKQKGFTEVESPMFQNLSNSKIQPSKTSDFPLRTFKNKNGETVRIMNFNDGKVITYFNEKTGVSEDMHFDKNGKFEFGTVMVPDKSSRRKVHEYTYELDSQGNKIPLSYGESEVQIMAGSTGYLQIRG